MGFLKELHPSGAGGGGSLLQVLLMLCQRFLKPRKAVPLPRENGLVFGSCHLVNAMDTGRLRVARRGRESYFSWQEGRVTGTRPFAAVIVPTQRVLADVAPWLKCHPMH